VSASGYYAWRSQPESPRKSANRELLSDIRRIHDDHRGRYGAPRIHAELHAEGQSVSRKRVERVMRQHGIRAHAPRRYRVCTTDSIYRPRFLRHLNGGYAAFAAGESCSARMAAGGRKPCRSISQVVL
jgi:hypothetical protein